MAFIFSSGRTIISPVSEKVRQMSPKARSETAPLRQSAVTPLPIISGVFGMVRMTAVSPPRREEINAVEIPAAMETKHRPSRETPLRASSPSSSSKFCGLTARKI